MEPLYIDNSTLASMACSTEAVMRYVHGYTTRDERAYLKAGTGGHEMAAVHLRRGSKEEALAAFEASYRVWADENVPVGDRLTYENTRKILSAWIDRHPLNAFPFVVDPGYVEIGFAFPLDDDGEFVFCGRMDGIARAVEMTGLYVIEHKFPGRINPTWIKQFKMGSQLSGYIWAAQQHTQEPVVGAFVNAVEFSKLPSSDRRCATHAVTYEECGYLHANSDLFVVTRTPEQIEEWRKTAIHLARRFRDLLTRYSDLNQIHKVRMQGTFHNRCQFCAFYDWCSTGRSLDLVDTLLVHDPWHPYEGAFSGRTSAHKP